MLISRYLPWLHQAGLSILRLAARYQSAVSLRTSLKIKPDREQNASPRRGTPVPAAMRDLSAWHTDSFANGPSWPDFTKALGIDEGSAAKTSGSVYVVSVYRAAPGHRELLEKSLSQNPRGNTASGNVLMQHLEGGPWTYLTVVRYNSWEDFATGEKNGIADTLKPGGGWLQLREHSTYHNDTITDRIAP